MQYLNWLDAINNPPKMADGYEYLCQCEDGCYWLCEYSHNGWVQLGSIAQPNGVREYADFRPTHNKAEKSEQYNREPSELLQHALQLAQESADLAQRIRHRNPVTLEHEDTKNQTPRLPEK